MNCPNCGILAPADQRTCRACGLKLPESPELLPEKAPQAPDNVRGQKRKIEKRRLRLWTCAGAVFYVALYWAIISQIIIGKGHVLRGILFLLVITAISIGGLLILYSSAVRKRSKYRPSDRAGRKGDTSRELSETSDLKTSVTKHTTELLEKDKSKEAARDH